MSFEELLKTISPTLKRITYKLNGHFSFFNDEDLYQEALLRLWVDFKGGKLADKTESYILQGCYFHLKNYIRKAQDKACLVSMDTLASEQGADLEKLLPCAPQGPCFQRLEDKVLSERIQVFGLTPREKEVSALCLEGLTVREIGRRLEISHVRVVKIKNKIKNKCEKFKEELKQSYQNR